MINNSHCNIIVELQETMGSDSSICNAAWTSSYDKTKRDTKLVKDEDVKRVVELLAKDGHGTPFESVVFRFWIRMPIFCDRQHMTYRIGSHNGLSGRYRTMPTDYFGLPTDVHNILCKADATLINKYYDSCDLAIKNYINSIEVLKTSEKQNIITNDEYKRAREILRGQLPTSGFVERTSILNLRSLANYFKQRLPKNAQVETRQIAEKMLECIKQSNICPIAISALEAKNWVI